MSNIRDIAPDVVRAILFLAKLSRYRKGDLWDGTKAWSDWGGGNATLYLGTAVREMCEAGFSQTVIEAAIRECLKHGYLTHNAPSVPARIEDMSLSKDSTFDVFLKTLELLDIGGRKAVATEEEGPVPPNGFRWKGKVYAPLVKGPFLALAAAWPNDGRCIHKDDLTTALGDSEMWLADSAMHSIRGQLNKFFRRNRIPFHATVKGLLLAIQDGFPRATARKRQPAKKIGKRQNSR